MAWNQFSRRAFVKQGGHLMGGMVLGVAGSPLATAADKKLEKIIAEFYEAYEKVDIERMMALLADDCYFEDPTFHLSASGKREIKKMAQSLSKNLSNVEIAIENRIVC